MFSKRFSRKEFAKPKKRTEVEQMVLESHLGEKSFQKEKMVSNKLGKCAETLFQNTCHQRFPKQR